MQVTSTLRSTKKRNNVYDVNVTFLTYQGTSAQSAYNAAQQLVNGGSNFLGASYVLSNASYASFSTPFANECSASDPDACSKNGSCVATSGNSSFCDCASGFAGNQCQNSSSNWSPNEVSASSHNFKANLTIDSGSDVSFVVQVPSFYNQFPLRTGKSYATTTFLKFNGSSTSCDYPDHPSWRLSSTSSGFDVYENAFSYSEAILCGLSRDNTSSNDYLFYNNSLTISRNFVIVHSIFRLNRTSSMNNKFSILFPKKVSVSTSVDLKDNNVTEFAAITDSRYDPGTDKWYFIFTAVTTAPYRLQYHSGSNVISGPSNRVNTNGISLLGCSPAVPDDSGECYQEFQITADGCQSLDFDLIVPMNVTCRANSNSACPNPSNSTFSPTFQVSTGSACPMEKSVPLSNLTLTSFSNSSLSENKTTFGASESLYFGVSFRTPLNVTSTGITINSVCVGSQSGTCSNGDQVTFSSSTPPQGFNNLVYNSIPIFASFRVEGSDITSKTSSSPVVIQVDFTITYGSGFSKRSLRFVNEKVGAIVQMIPDSEIKEMENRPIPNLEYSLPSSGLIVAPILVVYFLYLAMIVL